MREIKFRGYDSTIKRWVYGDLTQVKDSGIFFIGEDNISFENVQGNSVGQYTGLKDKNGVEIYEGDVIQATRYAKYVIIFKSGAFGYMSNNGWFIPLSHTFENHKCDDTWVVLGNIYDNPELMKGGEK